MHHSAVSRSTPRRMALTGAVSILMAVTMSASASAAFDIESFRGGAYDPSGHRVAQAGSHPDVTTELRFPSRPNPANGFPEVEENFREAAVDLPPGLVANPSAGPKCDAAVLPLRAAQQSDEMCPAETQVGIVDVALATSGTIIAFPVPLYNVEAPTGVAGRLQFLVVTTLISIDAGIRTGGDYGITAKISGASQSLALVASKVTLWGVPADPAHDAQRRGGLSYPPLASTAPRVPFVSLPTSCPGTPVATRVALTTWQQPTRLLTAAFDTDLEGFPLIGEGCEDTLFTPSAALAPTTDAPDAPTGLDVDITSPQNLESPHGLADRASARRAR